MVNKELARLFDRIADLLEIQGADGFRINSYRRAARTIKDAPEDIVVLAKEKRLTDLPGIGKGTAERIDQYLSTGHIDALDELQKRIPEGLPSLLDIPGMGPKKIALVHDKLGVKNMGDLKRVIESGEMAELPGLGETSVQRIAEGIAFLETSGERAPLGVAMPVAEHFAERVRGIAGVRRVEIGGSLRRGEETIGDIDLLCAARDGKKIVEPFTKLEGVQRVLASGATKGSVVVETEGGRGVQIDLRVVPEESFGAAWQYFTGSKDHNVRLREMAIKKKWRLNEYGLFDGEKQIAGKTEESIYKRIGLPLIPPELRQDRGEFEKGFVCDDLVTPGDVRGDLHMHTTASDGKCSIEVMAEAAKKLGYKYIAICDHSKSATIANGLSIDRMKKHIDDVRRADDKVKGITILVGCECDILPDGSLDYPDSILSRCDWVVASIHSAMGASKSKKHSPTERTIAAIENAYVSAIGHPTGRLINRRAAMDIDIGKVVEAAARTRTMLEVNASWQRLDLKDLHIREALSAGVMLTINTDAHHTDQLQQMRYGVMTARRGNAPRTSIANCCTPAALKKHIAAKRN